MEFLLGLFIGASFWTWFLFLGFLVIGVLSVEYESSAVAFLGLVAFILGLHFLTDIPIFPFIFQNPIIVLAVIFAYAVLGGIWAMFISWPEWLEDRSSEIKRAFDKWTERQIKGEDGEYKNLWFSDSGVSFELSGSYRDFLASKNKETIIFMISTWIFDAIWKAISRPIKFVATRFYNIFARGFENVGRRTTSKIISEEMKAFNDGK